MGTHPIFESDFDCLTEKMAVVRSVSNCVYTNLAYEEFLFQKRFRATQSPMLFLWRNKPSVVIGRFQNPWLEINVPYAKENQINIARRVSGGGTVYHDPGNINLSFITSRKEYSRKKNLGIICDAVRELMPQTNVFVNDRDDIILDEKWKISGSAARLLRLEALHHCTLLVDSDVGILNQVLTSNSDMETSATRSLRVDVKTLSDVGIKDNQALETSLAENWSKTYQENYKKVETVDPESIEEIQERVDELKKWKWVFGQTPKFTLETEDSIVTCSKGKILSVRLKSGMELSSFEGVMLEDLHQIVAESEVEEAARKQIILELV